MLLFITLDKCCNILLVVVLYSKSKELSSTVEYFVVIANQNLMMELLVKIKYAILVPNNKTKCKPYCKVAKYHFVFSNQPYQIF